MDVDIGFLYLWLPFIDEETQLIVQLMDKLEDIEELWTLGLVGAEFKGFLVLLHCSLKVVQLSVYYPQHLVYLSYLA